MPDHVDDSYQVFANGQYIGEFGHFTSNHVENFRSRVRTFQLPPPDQNGNIVIAIRFYMEHFVLAGGTTGASGGMHGEPLIGLQDQIESIRQQEVTGRILSIIASIFVAFIMLIAAAGALWIWVLDRPRLTYLWLALGLVLSAIPVAVLAISFFSYALTQEAGNLLGNGSLALGLFCWIFFWRQWFELTDDRKSDLIIVFFTAVVILIQLFIVIDPNASAHVLIGILDTRAICNAALGIMLFISLLQGARKDRTGALAALPPIVLLAISLFSLELLTWFQIRTSIFPFGVQITIKDFANLLLVLVTGALVARRFVSSQVSQRLERQTIDQELEQASELQQRVLIPEPITSALFAVETAYHPARSVGGDFFQVIAHPDGSLLIVVGDVSGKGVAAAMLVAVLVGAIRTRADETFDPAAILHTLNDRLLGRAGDHFATCIVAHLRPGGFMQIANAGHLPPYRNGAALDIPGSIPLGIVPGAHYDVHNLQLAPSDHLTFLTDGVPEARNATGALFGFDRLAELSSQTPGVIVDAAIAHGQDDDITIVSVRLRAAATA
jgi:hypothetical protein